MYLRQNPFPSRRPFAGSAASGQRGVVLLVALIILVALTLAGVALLRSVDTANLIAGNLSFHQAAIHAGERSTELAINWLEPNSPVGNVTLFTDSPATNGSGNGYIASRQDPGAGVSWDAFWSATLAAQATAGAQDAAGNTVSYVIHRLCDAAGPPQSVNCAKSPAGSAGGSQSAGGLGGLTNNQVYYRITTRIAGPRNTVAYIQTIIAL